MRLSIVSPVLADAVRPGDDLYVLRNGQPLHQRRNLARLHQLCRVRGLEELRRSGTVVLLEYPDLARYLLLGGLPCVRAAERAVANYVRPRPRTMPAPSPSVRSQVPERAPERLRGAGAGAGAWVTGAGCGRWSGAPGAGSWSCCRSGSGRRSGRRSRCSGRPAIVVRCCYMRPEPTPV